MNADGTYLAKFIGGTADGDNEVPFYRYVLQVERAGTLYRHTGWEPQKKSAPGPQSDGVDPDGDNRPVFAVYEPVSLIVGDAL